MSSQAHTEPGLAWLLRAPIVTVDETAYLGRDVVAAGALCGRWPALERELVAGLAAVLDERPARAEVAAAMREFRYARKLISAEDFLAWAAGWRLETSDVRASVERGVARRRAAGGGAPDLGEHRDAALEALAAEAVCTGALRECAVWLVDRVLVARGEQPLGPDAGAELLGVEDGLLAAGILDEAPSDRRRRLATLARAARAYDRHAEAVSSPDAIARCIGGHAVDWARYTLAGVACPTEGAAAEALLLIRDDGVAVDSVARLVGVEPAHLATRLEDAPAALRPRLVGASDGDVVGPVATDGAHWVWAVGSRVAATPADADLQARARALVLGADIERRAAGRVRWHERH